MSTGRHSAPRHSVGEVVGHLALTACIALLAAGAARADRGSRMPGTIPATVVQECAACHIVYPPGLLSKSSWGRIMQGLPQHYGVDASMDAKAVAEVSAWLQLHAETGKRVVPNPPEDRLTRSPWFERKHRSISDGVWVLPSVKRAANCAACHTGAERGDFEDDALRFPPGVTARWTVGRP